MRRVSIETDILIHHYNVLIVAGCCLMAFLGCQRSFSEPRIEHEHPHDSRAGGPDIAFALVAAELGLDFTWPQQPRPMRSNEAFGCGCAAFDFNNDGWQDVLLIGDPQPHLFENDGSGKFLDVTAGSGLQNLSGDWTGCAIADYDGDGWLDVLVTGVHQLVLMRNLNGGKFENTTVQAGLDPKNHEKWGASAGFMDLDQDGWLDLVILNYVQFGPDSKQYCELRPGIKSGCPPKEYPPERGEIWRNSGNRGFELVATEQGMSLTTGVGLVLAFADLDDDRLMDVYIGNDGVPADLLHNLGEMKFENIGVSSGVALGPDATPMAAMGADWADFDRDGLLDLTISNFDHRSFAVFRNEGNLFFSDVAHKTGVAGITRARLGFGSNWLDFDNDGWPDLAFVNGHVYDNVHELDPGSTFRQPSFLLRNEEGRRFVDLVPQLAPEIGKPLVGRGSVTLDFDNDGSMDFLAVDYEGTPFLLHNRTQTANSWITLDLRAAFPNGFAYGARAIGTSGSHLWISEVSPASSYLSSKDPRLHWGLGNLQRLETLTVRWPSGKVTTRTNVPANQILKIEEIH